MSYQRSGVLESIRGLASLQVLFLHTFSAFVPALVASRGSSTWAAIFHKSPFFFLIDGYSAVYIFFTLSGVVLTFAFQKQGERPVAALCARVMRLMIPAVAACLFALVLKTVFGDANVAASEVTGSLWMGDLWRPFPGLTYFFKDAFLNSVWLGYHGQFVIGQDLLGDWVDQGSRAYVTPLWSISVELQGSALVLLLVAASRHSTRIWLCFLGVLGLLLFRTHYVCFFVGHLLALRIIRRTAEGRSVFLRRHVIAACLLAGVALCVSEEFLRLPFVDAACRAPLGFSIPCRLFPQKTYGGMLVFIGLAFSADLHRWLSRRALTWLGGLSFPIYLVHWPIVMGAGSYGLVELAPWSGALVAEVSACALVFAMTFAAAIPFRRIDGWAVAAARRFREAVPTLDWRARRSPTCG